MEIRFAITIVIEIAFVVAFLYALWHEGRIIAFEERMEDAVARWLAKKIINRRRRAAVDRSSVFNQWNDTTCVKFAIKEEV